jgi:hypothetical protein
MPEKKPFQFKFFLPDARVLDEQEIGEMEKHEDAVSASNQEGLWIEIKCPDRSCLDDQGRLTLPVTEQETETEGVFLNLFCPEGRCQIVQSTDIV